MSHMLLVKAPSEIKLKTNSTLLHLKQSMEWKSLENLAWFWILCSGEILSPLLHMACRAEKKSNSQHTSFTLSSDTSNSQCGRYIHWCRVYMQGWMMLLEENEPHSLSTSGKETCLLQQVAHLPIYLSFSGDSKKLRRTVFTTPDLTEFASSHQLSTISSRSQSCTYQHWPKYSSFALLET